MPAGIVEPPAEDDAEADLHEAFERHVAVDAHVPEAHGHLAGENEAPHAALEGDAAGLDGRSAVGGIAVDGEGVRPHAKRCRTQAQAPGEAQRRGGHEGARRAARRHRIDDERATQRRVRADGVRARAGEVRLLGLPAPLVRQAPPDGEVEPVVADVHVRVVRANVAPVDDIAFDDEGLDAVGAAVALQHGAAGDDGRTGQDDPASEVVVTGERDRALDAHMGERRAFDATGRGKRLDGAAAGEDAARRLARRSAEERDGVAALLEAQAVRADVQHAAAEFDAPAEGEVAARDGRRGRRRVDPDVPERTA